MVPRAISDRTLKMKPGLSYDRSGFLSFVRSVIHLDPWESIPGQRVSKGDVLMSIEAMKMESLVCAEREGTIAQIHVKHRDTVPAKALLMEIV